MIGRTMGLWRGGGSAGLLAVALAVGLSSGACAPKPVASSWEQDIEAANQLFREGKLVESEAAYRGVVAKAEAFGPKDLRLATSLNNLAAACDALGKFGDAEALYLRSLSVREAPLGPDDLIIAKSVNNLAAFYQYDSEAGKVEPLLKRALEIRTKTAGPDHVLVAQSWDNLGLFNFLEGNEAQAEECWRKSLAIRDKGADVDADRALTMASLSFACMATGKREDAAKFLGRAEKALPEKPALRIDADLVDSKKIAKAIQVKQLPAPFAEPLMRRRALVLRRLKGPADPDSISAARDLANLLKSLGRDNESSAILARANLRPEPVRPASGASAAGSAAPVSR